PGSGSTGCLVRLPREGQRHYRRRDHGAGSRQHGKQHPVRPGLRAAQERPAGRGRAEQHDLQGECRPDVPLFHRLKEGNSMTTARIGWGAQMWLDNASNVLTELGEITEISLPNPQVADVEATHFKSANRHREYIAGLIEDGEGKFSMNYDPNSASDVILRA